MKCKCPYLPDIFYLEDGPKGFEKVLHQLEMDNWMRLYSCPHCGDLWAIDEWDKYQIQVVNRVKDKRNWSKDPKIRGHHTEFKSIKDLVANLDL